MTALSRYAIYFAAGADSALSRFGAELLGYDVYTGDEFPFPHAALHVAPDWRDITADPRKYGFHGTLKAPMALAPGKTEAELVAACAAFAGKARPIPVDPPGRRRHQRLHCRHSGRAGRALQQLAADCVRDFDASAPP